MASKLPIIVPRKNGEYLQILITDIKFNAEIDDALFRPNELDE